MFFILSKLLGYLVNPLVIICALLLASFILRSARWKRILRITGISLLFFFSNHFIANEVMHIWELPARPFEELPHYKVAILLTGITSNKPLGPDDRVYFYLGADRATHTMQLYKLGYVDSIIISGGNGRLVDNGYRESVRLRELLQLTGVPDSSLFVDASSDNTRENAVESRKLLDSLGIDPSQCILVTSAFHMRRALACFRKVGANVDYFPCDMRSHPRVITPDVLFIPKTEAILVWQKLLKEWTGMLAYKVAGYI
jgi:uncharacterized SAM-binding protein YcdF (DUF218 family)